MSDPLLNPAGGREGNEDTMHDRSMAFLGLGGMGAAMAARLLERRYALTVWNRRPSRAEPLTAGGARAAASPAAAVTGARTVLLSLADENAVEEVVFGAGGVAGALATGATVIDTSTVSPAYARRAAQRLGDLGLRRVEACVVGNPAHARKGELRVFAAGPPEDVDTVRPVLDALGRQVVHVGEPGAAATLKLALNLLLGSQLAALAEAVSLGTAAGIDREALIDLIGGSGFSSPVMSFRCPAMRDRRYAPPSFRLRLMAKDLRLSLGEAQALGLELPVTAQTLERFSGAVGAGFGDLDAAAVLAFQEGESPRAEAVGPTEERPGPTGARHPADAGGPALDRTGTAGAGGAVPGAGAAGGAAVGAVVPGEGSTFVDAGVTGGADSTAGAGGPALDRTGTAGAGGAVPGRTTTAGAGGAASGRSVTGGAGVTPSGPDAAATRLAARAGGAAAAGPPPPRADTTAGAGERRAGS
ncbi:NAD(P)-dependent oxidoreductase [Streptomyces sp. NPDC001889]